MIGRGKPGRPRGVQTLSQRDRAILAPPSQVCRRLECSLGAPQESEASVWLPLKYLETQKAKPHGPMLGTETLQCRVHGVARG